MGNWRAMGTAMRRRQGAPTNHAAGARKPVEPLSRREHREGREEGAAELKAGEMLWRNRGPGGGIANRPDGGFFG